MNWKKLKEFLSESESPLAFWSTYTIYLVMMIFFVYYSVSLQSDVFYSIIILLVGTGILFPTIYVFRRQNEKKNGK